MIYLGEWNRLKIMRTTSVGMFLADKVGHEVLLPKKYILPDFKVDDLVEVFVYKDHEDREVATTLEPFVQANEFAYLRVRTITQFGAFLEWGMEKDLMVPIKEQSKKMEEGHYYMVYVYLDEQSQRLTASSKINKFISNDELSFTVGEEVEATIFETTFLGFNAIVNNQYKGLIYHDDIFTDIAIGSTYKAFVKQIRSDNGLDLSLQPIGIQQLISTTKKLMDVLHASNGYLALHDDSTSELIKEKLQMSKKVFKKTIGILYKQHMIRIEKDGIYKGVVD